VAALGLVAGNRKPGHFIHADGGGLQPFQSSELGSYNTSVNLANFGTPSQNLQGSYVPREFQFAFHFGF
jgi:hypothetical protein